MRQQLLLVTIDGVHPFNFLIGASVALLSACLSSLGVNLQASALRAERELNALAESAGRGGLLVFETLTSSPVLDDRDGGSGGSDDDSDDTQPLLPTTTTTTTTTTTADAVYRVGGTGGGTGGGGGGPLANGAGGGAGPGGPLEPVTASAALASGTAIPLSLSPSLAPSQQPSTATEIRQQQQQQQQQHQQQQQQQLSDPTVFAMVRVLLTGLTPAPSSRLLSSQERSHLTTRLYIKTQWYLGFGLYLMCQLFGSVVALGFISPVVLAPLGSAGLIFNVVFSRVFLGTRITAYDWMGTGLIVVGCAVVSTFGSNVPDKRLSIDELIRLFSRPAFIAYFTVQLTLLACMVSLIKYLEYSLSPARRLISNPQHSIPPSPLMSPAAIRASRSSSAPGTSLMSTQQPQPPQQHILPASSSQTSLRHSSSEPNLVAISHQPNTPTVVPPHLVHHQQQLHHHLIHQSESFTMPNSISSPSHAHAHAPVLQTRSSLSRLQVQTDTASASGRDSYVSIIHYIDTPATAHPSALQSHPDGLPPRAPRPPRAPGSVGWSSTLSSSLSASGGPRSSVRSVGGGGGGGRDSVTSVRSVTIRVRRGQLTSLVGILYAIVGGIAASETLLLTKSGVELIVTTILDGATNQFQGLFAFVLLAVLGVTIFMQLYSLNKALHYHLPLFVIPVFYTLFTCLSLANTMVYLDQLSVYSAVDLACLTAGIVVIIGGVWVLAQSGGDSDGDGDDGGGGVGNNGSNDPDDSRDESDNERLASRTADHWVTAV